MTSPSPQWAARPLKIRVSSPSLPPPGFWAPKCWTATVSLTGVSRLERLVNLMAALIETERPLTRAEIRERVPGYTGDDSAYRRAFERDKDTLRNMGIPVAMT